MSYSLKNLASLVDGELVGDESAIVKHLSPLDDIAAQSLVMAKGPDALALAEHSKATALLTGIDATPGKKPAIRVDNPSLALAKLLAHFYPEKKPTPGIHPSATIDESAEIAASACVGPHVVIGKNVRIGEHSHLHAGVKLGDNTSLGANCTLHANVVVYPGTSMGDKVVIHAQTVVGSDGFGYEFDGQAHIKLPHVGKVIIESDVEIGANTVIDRGTLGNTHIGYGSKIDNLVQIAHNVRLGKHNIVCAYTGIAGSCTLGDYVICAANVGISDHVTVEDKVILAPRTGIASNKRLAEGTTWYGNPGRPFKKAIEIVTMQGQLPSIKAKLKTLDARLKSLENV